MKYRLVKVAVCGLMTVMMLSSNELTASAATGVNSVLPAGGVNLTLVKKTSLESLQKDTDTATTKIESMIELAPALEVAVKTEAEAEEESFKNLVIAQVNDYVNVRSMPSEEGEIIGKLYNKSAGDFISEVDGWYEIKSGSVTGYVKGEYCVTGEAAIELAKQVGTRIATVDTTTLFVRQEPTTESSVVGMVPDQEELLVTEELDGWVKVDVEEGYGYVSTDYVTLKTEFVKAESKAEEEARLAKEAEERRIARENAKKSQSKSQTNTTTSVTISGDSEMGTSVAQYAVQFVGNPYVWGGTSLTEGADCSGFVMSVYANFGVSLPHSSAADRSQGYAVDGLENAQPGDIICYSGHVAIYIGDGQIVHASTAKTGIIISNADYRKILAVRRIF